MSLWRRPRLHFPMPGKPQRKIRLVSDLVAWHNELSTDFRKLLPSMYRYRGVNNSGDARRDAWGNCDRLVTTTGKALAELEAVLRTAEIGKTKRRGRQKTEEKTEESPEENVRIGAPMFVDE